MNNIKCPNCGFINFVQEEYCRKCNTGLHTMYQAQYQTQYQPQQYQQQPYYNTQTSNYGYGYANQYPSYYTNQKTGFPLLKVFLGVFIGLVVVSAITGGGAAFLKRTSKTNWREFRPDGSRMAVMMPSEPRTEEPISTPTQMGNIVNHIYISKVSGQGTAMFCYVDLPFDVNSYSEISPERILDEELNDLLKRTNSTLISKHGISLGSYTGLEFELKPPGNLSEPIEKGIGRFYLKGKQLYLLVLTARENTELKTGKDKFLNPSVY